MRLFLAKLRTSLSNRKSECFYIDTRLPTIDFSSSSLDYAIKAAYRKSIFLQGEFPDGLTVFGQDAFLNGIRQYYKVDSLSLRSNLYDDISAHEQVRKAYLTRIQWQKMFPCALSDLSQAKNMLQWMLSSDANLSMDVVNWLSMFDLDCLAKKVSQLGINVFGHFGYVSGLKTSVDVICEAMARNDVNIVKCDVPVHSTDINDLSNLMNTELYDISLLHIQPDPFFNTAYERASLAEREPKTYRIAYWYWELSSIPDSWAAGCHDVDEIWTATEYIAQGIRRAFNVPVKVLFSCVQLESFEPLTKADFGLDENKYSFLFAFHMASVMERKNPLGLIRAFKLAFSPDEAVELVIKTTGADLHPQDFELLMIAANGHNIKILSETYDKDKTLALMNACDAYVSLHRCEGFGLTMAESMLLGKPVIATNYSGNLSYMNEKNSLLVNMELIKVGEGNYPYQPDVEWAYPSEEHAAEHMRRLFNDRDFAQQLGTRAQIDVSKSCSLEAAGYKMKERLMEIQQQMYFN